MKKTFQHQHDLNGCGIACLANLIGMDYLDTRNDFETKFYKVDRGIKFSDLVKFLNSKGFSYSSKFFNHNKYNREEAHKFALIKDSITLIRKNDRYPIGHYLLRSKNGWIDPWINYPSINNVHAGLRSELPGEPWYVIYPNG